MFVRRKEGNYHGTSSKFIRRILKVGFDAEPKKKVWDIGDLASYSGTYFTNNFMTAYSSAGEATRKFGGGYTIFEVQVETKESLIDEDHLPRIEDVLNKASGVYFRGSSYWARYYLDPENSKELQELLNGVVWNWMEEFEMLVVNPVYLEKYPRKIYNIKVKLSPLLKEWALVYLKDLLHREDREGDEKDKRSVISKIMDVFNMGIAKEDKFIFNVRRTKSTKYRGSNKILSCSILLDVYPDITGIVKIYKEPSDNFISNVKKHINPVIEIFTKEEFEKGIEIGRDYRIGDPVLLYLRDVL